MPTNTLKLTPQYYIIDITKLVVDLELVRDKLLLLNQNTYINSVKIHVNTKYNYFLRQNLS